MPVSLLDCETSASVSFVVGCEVVVPGCTRHGPKRPLAFASGGALVSSARTKAPTLAFARAF